jgi:hypothetical protein
VLGPLEGLRIRRLISQIEAFEPRRAEAPITPAPIAGGR